MQRVELVHSNQTLVIERTGKDTKESPWRVIRGEDILEQPKPQLVLRPVLPRERAGEGLCG